MLNPHGPSELWTCCDGERTNHQFVDPILMGSQLDASLWVNSTVANLSQAHLRQQTKERPSRQGCGHLSWACGRLKHASSQIQKFPQNKFLALQVTHGMSSSNVSTGEAKDCHPVRGWWCMKSYEIKKCPMGIHTWILWKPVALELSIGFTEKKSASPALCTVCATAIGSETRHTWQQVHHPNTVKKKR